MRLFRKKPSPDHPFWKWFRENSSELHRTQDYETIVRQFGTHTQNVLVEMLTGDGVRKSTLVITPDGQFQALTEAYQWYESASKVADWDFVLFRQRLPRGSGLTFNAVEFDPWDCKVLITGKSKWRHMPVVTYAIDVYLPIPTQSSAFLNAAGVLALDHTLGEELHMFRLAKATFYSAQNLNPNAMSMQEFVDFLEEHPGHGIWNEPRFRR